MAGVTSYTDDGDGPTISEINVTPLVDIVLVLLIVFMITMPTIVAENVRKERDLDVRLPQAAQAQAPTKPTDDLIVNVRTTGVYVVRGDVYTRDELFDLLKKKAADGDPSKIAVQIRADREALWDHVVVVLDMCSAVKITNCRAAVAD